MKTIYSVLFSMFLLLTGHTLSAQLPQIIGTTQAGGANNAGIICKSNFDGSAFTPVYSFDYQSGTAPAGKLVQATNKLLYGENTDGGHNGAGCLFSYDPVNNIYKNVFNFNGTNGREPSGGLLLANNGLLYGTTFDGGSETPGGTLFSFTPRPIFAPYYWSFPIKVQPVFFLDVH